jgi:hypothetical protein
MGDEAMSRFMKGDGDNYWDHPNGRQVEYIRQAAVLRAICLYLSGKQDRAVQMDTRESVVEIIPARAHPLWAELRPASPPEKGEL